MARRAAALEDGELWRRVWFTLGTLAIYRLGAHIPLAAALASYGGTIEGQAPGEATARYLASVRNRLTLVGALYVAAICLLPEILVSHYNAPFYFGGSSLLIVVCVAMDLLAHIRAHLGRPDPVLVSCPPIAPAGTD